MQNVCEIADLVPNWLYYIFLEVKVFGICGFKESEETHRPSLETYCIFKTLKNLGVKSLKDKQDCGLKRHCNLE